MDHHHPISSQNDPYKSQSGQNEAQSHCSQCLRLNQLHSHHSCQQCQHQLASQEFIVPLKRIQISKGQNNTVHTQLQQLIKQVQYLKREHQKKDRVIDELRNQIKQQKQFRLMNIINQQKQDIEILKSDIQSLSSPKFRKMQQSKNKGHKDMKSTSPTKQSEYNQFDDYELQEKFEFGKKKQKKIYEIWEKKVIKLEEDIHWMRNFIIAFLEMIDKLSSYYGQNIFFDKWTIKKKAKVGWRYLKHLIQFWLDQS